MSVEIKGGEKLQAALKKISENVSKASKLKVGFLENATYPDGTSVAMVAAIQEFGAPKVGIPPRPYFRTMVAEKSPEWPAAVGTLLKQNSFDGERTLNQMGEGIKGQLQESIINTNSPALSPVTVMLRGMRANDSSLVVTGKTVGEAAQRVADGKTNYGASTKPLIDSGHLENSVDYQVES